MIIATTNKGKAREFAQILGKAAGELRTMTEAGLVMDIREDGETFEANAMIKARSVAMATGYTEPVIADDSGLEVDCMDGAPGVYSARWMGEDTSYDIKNRELIRIASQVPPEQRGARYVCAIALVMPDHEGYFFRGTMEGVIADEPAGENGFGYDPVFYVPEMGKTAAQMTPEEKNAISHRGKALAAAKEKLEEMRWA